MSESTPPSIRPTRTSTRPTTSDETAAGGTVAQETAPAAANGTKPAPRTSGSGAPTTAGPTTGARPTVPGPRRVRLAISRVDPWSVLKLSFLLSFAIGILIVVAVAVVWATLDGLGVFAEIDSLIQQIFGTESPIDILSYLEFSRIISGAMLVAFVDIVLLTALGTIGAFLYNIVAAVVGGLHVTMTDD